MIIDIENMLLRCIILEHRIQLYYLVSDISDLRAPMVALAWEN
jgi:hypothetical protein